MAKIKINCIVLFIAVALPCAAQQSDLRERVQKTYNLEIGVRELTGNNDGRQVEQYLAYVHLKKGNPWCAAFVCWSLGQNSVVNPRSGYCPDLFRSKYVIWRHGGKLNKPPDRGDVFGLYFPEKGRIAHVGFVDQWGAVTTITVEGNTNDAGSREGDGVYRKKAFNQADLCRKQVHTMKQITLLIALLAVLLLLSGCSSRRTDTKISKKVTENETKSSQDTRLKLIDTAKKQVQKFRFTQGSMVHELTVYARPGATLKIARDGSISGPVDSVKSLRSGQKSTTTELNKTEVSGKIVDSTGKSANSAKGSTTEQVKDKTTERTGTSMFFISVVIIVAVILLVELTTRKRT